MNLSQILNITILRNEEPMPVSVNPKYKENPVIKRFEEWVKKNYEGKIMPDKPEGIDLNTVFYYKIDDTQYGPIPYKKVPKSFR